MRKILVCENCKNVPDVDTITTKIHEAVMESVMNDCPANAWWTCNGCDTIAEITIHGVIVEGIITTEPPEG